MLTLKIALALHSALLQLGFLKVMTYAILLISPGPWVQAKTQQPIGVVGPVIIHNQWAKHPIYFRLWHG